ncbi:MAG: HAD-IIIA family hydrolase [bacterium]|nr:MAG: HAD-IIIA family hydrolase [bacterium]
MPVKGREHGSGDLLEAAGKIKLLAFDVDGVLTDGRITYASSGEEIKSFDVRDGHAVKMAFRAGLEVAIITGRESSIVQRRADELGIRLVYQGAKDKGQVLSSLLSRTGLAPHQISYMGDDVVDLPVLQAVGLSAAPADAVPEVVQRVAMVTEAKGGSGAARELILFVLKAQGLYGKIMERYGLHDTAG